MSNVNEVGFIAASLLVVSEVFKSRSDVKYLLFKSHKF